MSPQPEWTSADSFHLALFLGLWAALAAIYLLPTLVAFLRTHPSIAGIFVLNLLLGWTLMFWVLSLVWALSGFQSDRPQYIVMRRPPAH